MADRKRLPWFALLFRLLVGVGLLALSVMILAYLVSTKPVPARVEGGAPPPRIIVMAAQPVEVQRQWVGFGTARAMDATNVPARVHATVEQVPDGIVAGARVGAGTLLVALDDSDFRHQEEVTSQAIADIDAQLARMAIERTSWAERIRIATAQVEIAQADYERFVNAGAQGAAQPRELDAARQILNVALRDQVITQEELDKLGPRELSLRAQRGGLDAQLRLARQSVERCQITSPYAGVLQTVDVEVGESVTSGTRIARVVDLRVIEVPLRLPADARVSVRPGDLVTLATTGRSPQLRTAPIARIAPEDDPATRTMSVYVEVTQGGNAETRGDEFLAPGQFLVGTVVSSIVERRWVVPRRSLDGDRVRIVKDGVIASLDIEIDDQLETTFPKLGLPDTAWVILVDALPEETQVVVTASRSLVDGLVVDPVRATLHARRGPTPETAETTE